MSSTSVTFAELEAAVKPAATTEAQATQTATETKTETRSEVQTQPQFTEADATALRAMADLGITPSNAQQFIQAKQVLDRLPEILRTNPRVVLDEMAKSDPAGYTSFLEAVSDEWYAKWEREHPEGNRQSNGTASSATSSTDPRMESKLTQLNEKIENLISERNQEKTSRQQETILNGYNSAVDELLSKLPKETPDLTKDHIRLKTNELLWKDSASRERVGKGIFVDLGSHFSKACSLVTADTKAANGKEHERRAEVEARGTREITPAADNVNGSVQAGPDEDKVWGSTGMIADIKKALSSK